MLPFKIAVRFLKSGGAQNLLIVIGIAVAISIQVFVGLLIDSLQRTLVSRTIGNSPLITILSSTDVNTIRDWENMVVELKNINEVKALAVSSTTTLLLKMEAVTCLSFLEVLILMTSIIYMISGVHCMRADHISHPGK